MYLRAEFWFASDHYRRVKKYGEQVSTLERWRQYAAQELIPEELAWDDQLEKALVLAKKRHAKTK